MLLLVGLAQISYWLKVVAELLLLRNIVAVIETSNTVDTFIVTAAKTRQLHGQGRLDRSYRDITIVIAIVGKKVLLRQTDGKKLDLR